MIQLSEETFRRWFTAETDKDSQLERIIRLNNYETKKPTFSEVSQTLFRCDSPYHNYERKELGDPMPYRAHITNNSTEQIAEMIGYPPSFGIEVGSFIGSSAILLGNYIKETNGVLLCIDTWCGDINMWLGEQFHSTMGKTDGNPNIFDRFMNNIIDNDLTENVIPLRVSSIVGARMLKVLKYEIDFIYLDSAHEAGETFMELSLYHDVLKPGGVIFGDDYTFFPAVTYDVNLFCEIHSYKLQTTPDHDTWIIQKGQYTEILKKWI